jgi:ice-binding like protein
MYIGGLAAVLIFVVVGSFRMHRSRTAHLALTRWKSATLVVFATTAALLVVGNQANAAIVPTVPLATSAFYSVLGGQTVTNTGPSVLNLSLGVSPGTAFPGFPPGLVNAPGEIHAADAAALQAQSDLTAAYLDAASRPLNATEPADLVGLTLVGGVYAVPAAETNLSGALTLDGQGDPNSVFIFQLPSTLITGSGSVVNLINQAQECNVFWQVGSSATLGTGSIFVGNILALTSITVTTGVTVHGRALARNGSVTLDTDTFTSPTCAGVTAPAPTTTVSGATTTVSGATTTVVGATASTVPNVVLPRTGRPVRTNLVLAAGAIALGAAATGVARRKRVPSTRA